MNTQLIITVLFLMLFNQGSGQEKNVSLEKKFGGALTCSEPTSSRIIRSDTSFSEGNSVRTVYSINNFEKVIRIETSTFNQKKGEKITERIQVFDTAEHLIFYSVSQNGFPFHCYSYEYDKKGRLICRSGYGSGDIGGTTRYVYEGDRLIKTIRE